MKPASGARRPEPKRDRPTIHGRSLLVGERRVPLFSAAVHYWHVPRNSWRRALTSIRDLGLSMVESYVPWGPHEIGKDHFDFGETNPQLDLGAFLDLAMELGLVVFLRPGPHINAELTYFGIPARVINDPACQAQSPSGRRVVLPFPPKMFPVPSYASTQYRDETAAWYRAVSKVVASRRYPDGPVVMLQIDNEATYFFRNSLYDQDYHPDAIRLYRRFLKQRFTSLKRLSARYGKRFALWKQVDPPRQFDAKETGDLPEHLDWAHFKEALIEDALLVFRQNLDEAGFGGLPTVHNLPLGDGGLPANPPKLRGVVDLVGFDYYHAAREHRAIKRRTLYLAGTFPLPYAPELGVGAPPWFTPLGHHDSLTCAMTALAYGLRGFNLYMGVDRDRWYGAPIDKKGRPRPEAEVWKSLLHALKQSSFHELNRDARVALVLPMEYRRLSRATQLLGGILSASAMEALGGTPIDACSEESLGFDGPIQMLWWKNLARLSDALTRAQVPYVYIDGEAEQERFNKDLLWVPSYEFLSQSLWQKLRRAEESGSQIMLGPRWPSMDENLQPATFPRLNRARLFDVEDAAGADKLVASVCATHGLGPEFKVEPSPLECTVHADELGPRVAFVLNPERQSKTARLSFEGHWLWTDCLNGEQFSGDETLRLTCPGLSVRMFRLQPTRDVGTQRPSARAPAPGAPNGDSL